ncbi:hypothetical protein [Methylobacterium sp. 391_Methyba4]|nr:hypothetical protein [Methylobacterium sp. 391_Methyba4]WFS09189.1 hypothetical protein P9K36_07845 [Methylobacterium sp. 391_Methyba4]
MWTESSRLEKPAWGEIPISEGTEPPLGQVPDDGAADRLGYADVWSTSR